MAFRNARSISPRSVRVPFSSKFSLVCGCRFVIVGSSPSAIAQASATQPPVTCTTDEGHQHMMDQLGIKALRPGYSGNEKAPNHANYDESKANPFPNVPDPLILNNGQRVTTPEIWWNVRRPELLEMFSKYVYGRIPQNVPKVSWTVTMVDHEMIGFTPVIAKDLIGEVDNSAYPAISVKIHMTLVTPAKAKGPVPVLIVFGRAVFPNPIELRGEVMERINKAWKALIVEQHSSLKDVFAQHPAWEPVRATPFQLPQLNEDDDLPNTWPLVAAGW